MKSGDDRAAPSNRGLLDLSKLSLSRLREELDALSDDEQVVRWALALQHDPRAGARVLGTRAQRQVDAVRSDRVRVEALFEIRARLYADGCRVVAGVDEVGVGPLAGPVVAAAVALPEKVELPGLDDSKKVSRSDRERLEKSIREQALGVALGEVSPVEIDRMNIYRAGLEAMRRASTALAEQLTIDRFMVDARTIPGMTIPQTALVHGDAIEGSIAAASIVAKVYRDRLMGQLDAEYPGYGLGRNMGYGTPEHMSALGRLGACAVHRQSFAPVAAAREI